MSMTSLLLHLILLLTQLQLTNAAWTLFAVTNSTHCAKSLPTGYKKINIEHFSIYIPVVSQVRRGHKNVPDEEMQESMMKMSQGKQGTGKLSGKLIVEFENFSTFVKETGVKRMLTTVYNCIT